MCCAPGGTSSGLDDLDLLGDLSADELLGAAPLPGAGADANALQAWGPPSALSVPPAGSSPGPAAGPVPPGTPTSDPAAAASVASEPPGRRAAASHEQEGLSFGPAAEAAASASRPQSTNGMVATPEAASAAGSQPTSPQNGPASWFNKLMTGAQQAASRVQSDAASGKQLPGGAVAANGHGATAMEGRPGSGSPAQPSPRPGGFQRRGSFRGRCKNLIDLAAMQAVPSHSKMCVGPCSAVEAVT